MTVWVKAAVALAPILLAALTTVAWQNSHSIALLAREYDDLRAEQAHQRRRKPCSRQGGGPPMAKDVNRGKGSKKKKKKKKKNPHGHQ